MHCAIAAERNKPIREFLAICAKYCNPGSRILASIGVFRCSVLVGENRNTADREPRSGRLQKTLQIAPLHLRRQLIAEAFADLFEDLARALGVDFVRHPDLLAELGTLGLPLTAKRVAS